MTAKVLPSLSEDGWVKSPEKIADYLLSHFFVADYSQTQMYVGNISSLPWILQKTRGDIQQTISLISSTLTTYFLRYFPDVALDVREVPNTESPSKAQISIYVNYTDETGTQHVLGKLLQYNDTIIDKIVTLSNG